MRTMIRFAMDVERSNAAIRDGVLPKIVQDTIEKLQPEAAYFFAEDGKRTAMFVFDLKNQSDIPWIVEPWLMETGASMTVHPVMSPADLKTGLEKAASEKRGTPVGV